jgi:S-adenosylmethionine decarboxylase
MFNVKDLAPHIYRQRLLIEGIYDREVDAGTIRQFFEVIAQGLGVTAAGAPIINESAGLGTPQNQGIEAFLPLIESGIAVYTWESSRFLSLIIYTCKAYDDARAMQITRDFFELTQFECKPF